MFHSEKLCYWLMKEKKSLELSLGTRTQQANNIFFPHCFSSVFHMKLFSLLQTDQTLMPLSPSLGEDSVTSQARVLGNSSVLDYYFSGELPIFVSNNIIIQNYSETDNLKHYCR